MTDSVSIDESVEPGGLAIGRAPRGGAVVVTVAGEVDHQTAGVLRSALMPPATADTPRTVADLAGVGFMDSSGINVLIAVHQAHEPTGWLRLAGVRRPVLRTLEMVGLTGLIHCYPDVDAALDA
ncbi:STAS domain-containing protein [Streptomyces sp. WP-1]|uniref:STAS domain-containing protein n=1 Tax=Streptomyces sp. WP-1 TaxID=3041497 RepID=UPI0026494DF9|nr:STAS domain-containing protein [Streptomyces sp. WP-1]WKE67968.1 STAS domain-containing protein [Streptomyces sp. WP-1]